MHGPPRHLSAPALESRTHVDERHGGEENGEEVDAEHHLKLIDLVLLEDAVLPLGGETVTHQVHGHEKQSQPLRAVVFCGAAALGQGEHAHSDSDGNRLPVPTGRLHVPCVGVGRIDNSGSCGRGKGEGWRDRWGSSICAWKL